MSAMANGGRISSARSTQISIVMPVYNASQTLDRAIASLLGQTFPWWEVLIVDDHSTDGTYERAFSWQRLDGRIRLFSTPTNSGPSAARNIALRRAIGQTIVYLDSDDEYYQNYLEHVARLRDRADVLIFGYDHMVEGGDQSQKQFWNPGIVKNRFFEENVSTPLGVAHRRDLLERVAGFNESSWAQEDWDLWKRFARVGAEFLFVPIASGVYYRREGSRSQAPRATSEQRTCFVSNMKGGGTIYESLQNQIPRTPRKVLYAGSGSSEDLSNPGSLWALSLMQVLADNGFECQGFAGFRAGERKGSELGHVPLSGSLQWTLRDSICGVFHARLAFMRSGRVPMTHVRPHPYDSSGYPVDPAMTVLAFYKTFLGTYQPDILLCQSECPDLDPIVRLAKRRDITIVALIPDDHYQDPTAFYNVDYCLAATDKLRDHYWESIGLSCVSLPVDENDVTTERKYLEFFGGLRPQPGPPFVPSDAGRPKGGQRGH